MIVQQSQPTFPVPMEFRHTICLVTAASLFDEHDAAINLMRRLIAAYGAGLVSAVYHGYFSNI